MSLSDHETLLLHNPNCSKSRAAKAWLDEQGHAYTERRYLEEPLSTAELAELRELLGAPARDWVRSGQGEYATAGLSKNSSDVEHYAAMVAAPILVERPIVVHGGAAAVGRPLANVIALFEDD